MKTLAVVRRGPLPLVLWFVTVCGCAGSPWRPLDPDRLADGLRYREAAVVVLEHEQSVRFQADEASGEPVADVTVRQLTRVLDRGRERFRTVGVSYKRAFSEVLDFRARALLPGGETFERRLDDAVDVPAAPDDVLYSDQRVLSFSFGALSAGTLVEVVHTVRHREPRLFLFQQAFGGDDPVLRMDFRVVVPDGWETREAAWHLNVERPWLPAVEAGDATRTLHWTRRDLPAIQAEDGGPPSWALSTTVSVQLARWKDADGRAVDGFRDDRELSAWLYQLADGTARPGEAMRTFTEGLLAGTPDEPAARARVLYDWVRSQVRYCAVEVGYGSWRPHEADRVWDVRYGDCKDKANVLRAMLRVAGIDSRLAVLFSHRGYPRRFTLPVVTGNFNHMVLIVDLPDGPVVVDPTARSVPFGQLPAVDQGADLLPLSPTGDALQPTPIAEAAQNSEETELDVPLDVATGKAAGPFTFRARGTFAAGFEAKLRREGDGRRGKVVADWLDLHPVHTSHVSARLPDAASGVSDVEVSGSIRIENAVSGSGDTRLLRPVEFVESWAPKLGHGARQTPLVFPSTKRLRQRIRFELPAGWESSRLPGPVSLSNPHADYRLVWSMDGAHVTMERIFELRSVLIPEGDYAAFRSLCDAAHSAEAQPVILHAVRERSAP